MSEQTTFIAQTITCICGQKFEWTAGEQKFMEDLRRKGKLDEINPDTNEIVPGVVVPPKRCPDCRQKKKEWCKKNHPEDFQ